LAHGVLFLEKLCIYVVGLCAQIRFDGEAKNYFFLFAIGVA
jgi:hypothetical protein